ncbi:hypothetical protein M422DRAFT_246856 [Sphaerobolus stellatus SS14]|nr:hypothetical protein M422DRAFT_246856 [Sphaerobolus stellatus SS14]
MQFLENWFQSLTFSQVIALHLPPSLSPNAIQSWVYVSNPDGMQLSRTIDTEEFIPASSSLKTILNTMEKAYETGHQGVIMELYTPHGLKTMKVHFSKIGLFITINNHHSHMEAAQVLMH